MGDSYTLAFEFFNTQRAITAWVIVVVGSIGFAAIWLMGKPWKAVNTWRSQRKLDLSPVLSLLFVMLIWYFTCWRFMAEMFECDTVEGVVSEFVRTDNARGYFNRAEFAVGGVPFCVTHRHGAAAEILALPQWSGGPLRDGLHVRVRHHHGKIMRVEVRES